MPEPHVVTVAGPVPASAIGVVDAHDHLFVRSPALVGGELEDPALVAQEVLEAKASGVDTIVELTPIGLGRRPDLMQRVSSETGVQVIAATGYHRDAHYPAGQWVHDASVELLARRAIDDLRVGMLSNERDGEAADGPGPRAGVMNAGASYQRISASE
ncbi:MAG TPA: aryldialkylphosphatase, partial [Candidatus Dormibacteraeota bacterium]|nr:aryldialkylphosphatase [Candidatus Dormibacteraeota bacterium]